MSSLTYNSKYQNLHMDRANIESMKTVNITVTSALASSATPHLLYQYEHGLNYTPQFWGLWDVVYGAALGSITRRGYGMVSHNTGAAFSADLYYTVDSQYITLYWYTEDNFGTLPSTSGTEITFTGYMFANSTLEQDYT